jgi:nucleotide-binding universal stress UspA family protein
VNDTEVGRTALDHACSVARAFGACLTVLFVLESPHGDPTPESLRHAEKELRSWLSAEDGLEYELQPIVCHGDAAEQIVALARQAAVDLVVIGAQHRRFVDTTVLGVTTVRVTRYAPCPVLVVPCSSDAHSVDTIPVGSEDRYAPPIVWLRHAFTENMSGSGWLDPPRPPQHQSPGVERSAHGQVGRLI